MRILITGIAGFIGCNLTRALLEKGYHVEGIDNLSTGDATNLTGDETLHVADVTTHCYYNQFRRPFDCIIHLASKKIPRDGGAIWKAVGANLRIDPLYSMKVAHRVPFLTEEDST